MTVVKMRLSVFLMDKVDKPLFLKKLMNSDNSTCITGQPFSGDSRCNIFRLSQIDDVVSVLFVEILVFLEFNVIL